MLYRTLKAELEERDHPPKVLYLQLDNCIRENKNTVLFCALCWWIERGIFTIVYVSFLPSGHTHFDCDQLASRVSLPLRFSDVTSLDHLMRLLAGCVAPRPVVEMLEDVTDVKRLFNPTGQCTFPVTTSIVRRMHGLCTKTVPLEREAFMDATSPLHWKLTADKNGKICIQSKLTCDDDEWSEQHYPWTENAPRCVRCCTYMISINIYKYNHTYDCCTYIIHQLVRISYI